MINYFAYGSNLHPLRLKERIPSANLIGATKLSKHILTFHKKSHDGSGKCNIVKTASKSDLIHGAIYQLEPSHKNLLDTFESKGYGYLDEQINLFCEEREYNCFTYYAQESHIVENLKPYHWYKKLVLLGAKYLRFPHYYISAIENIKSMGDNNKERRMQNEILLEKVKQFN